jgi:hypothetical protein
MKRRVIRMRKTGIVIPGYELKNQVEMQGGPRIVDTLENKQNRIIKQAQLRRMRGAEIETHLLHEPQMLRMNEHRFVLTRLERVGDRDTAIDYAHSRSCKVELGRTSKCE